MTSLSILQGQSIARVDAVPIPSPSVLPMAPPPRQIIRRNDSNPGSHEDSSAFSVLSYNILCPQFASPAMYHYTPSWALPWEYRRNIIMEEIRRYSCEFVCLQEVDWDIYDYWLREEMKKEGYEGAYCPSWVKSLQRSQRDGVAIFWKTQRCVMLRIWPAKNLCIEAVFDQIRTYQKSALGVLEPRQPS